MEREEIFKVLEKKKIEKGAFKTLIVALPEIGFGSILAARQIINDLKMEMYGQVYCEYLATILRYEDKKAVPIIRLYGGESLLVLLYEGPMSGLELEFARFVVRFLRDKEINSVIMLGSAPTRSRMEKDDSELSVIAVGSNDAIMKNAEDAGAKALINGTIVGPYAYVINSRILDKKDALALLVETFHVPIADPASAVKLLEVMGKYLGLSERINISELLEKAEELKIQMKKLEEATKAPISREPVMGMYA